MHARMHTHTHTHAHTHAHMHACTHACTHKHKHAHMQSGVSILYYINMTHINCGVSIVCYIYITYTDYGLSTLYSVSMTHRLWSDYFIIIHITYLVCHTKALVISTVEGFCCTFLCSSPPPTPRNKVEGLGGGGIP